MANASNRISADASLAHASINASYFKKLLTSMNMTMGSGMGSIRDGNRRRQVLTLEYDPEAQQPMK